MKILLTGNRGYIGSVLSEMLLARGYEVMGFDVGYYDGCELAPMPQISRQIIKDIRNVGIEDVAGIDAVIHLAALSNDPLGELAPGLTEEINLGGTLKLAELAKQAGVKRFIYASSQSMYGVADTSHELTEDEAGPYGVTAYARTKWDAEVALKKMHADSFVVVCLRASTVFGASPNFRADIVYNSLVSSAFVTGKIEIKSDGTPWRPVVHVKDVSSAYLAGLEAPAVLVGGQSFNVGIPNGNFTVRDLAEAAQRAMPGSGLTFTGEHGSDSRTYRVSFNKILTVLKDFYKPEWNLDNGGKELVEFFKKVNFMEDQFRGRACNRLKQVNYLLEQKKLGSDLSMAIKVKQAVILAGGLGTRLRPLTNNIPKPMVLVNGRPFLEYLVEFLRDNGIQEIVLLVGYRAEKIVEHFGNGKEFGVNIRYSITPIEDDTGARLKKAGTLLDDHFFLFYSDNYWPMPLGEMISFFDEKGTLGMMTVYNNRDGGGEYGWKNNVRVDVDDYVLYYGGASEDPSINAIDVGAFLMSKAVLDFLPVGQDVSFQNTVLPELIKQKQLVAYRSDHPYYPLTSPAHVPIAGKFLTQKKVIFLDRDGVINKKVPAHGYVTRWGEFQFLPGVLDAIRMLTEAEYQIYIITNQRGIARGLMTEEDLAKIHAQMVEEIERAGGKISGIYHCPHDKDKKCFCRKPNPGMFFQAAREHHIDLTKALFVGDDPRDKEAGDAAGCKTILIESDGSLLAVVESIIKA